MARGIDVGSFLENPNRHIDQIHMREGDAEGSARIVLHTEGTTDAYALDLKRGDNLLDKLNETIAGAMRELPDPTKIPSFKPRPKVKLRRQKNYSNIFSLFHYLNVLAWMVVLR